MGMLRVFQLFCSRALSPARPAIAAVDLAMIAGYRINGS